MESVEDAHMDTAPPLVALHRVTANVLRFKSIWRFTLGHPLADTPSPRRSGPRSTPALSSSSPGPSAKGSSPRTPT
ncbi:hypothetical protein QBA75_39955 [Streptomyces stelliscabiei]